jgi:hypothetical protein
MNANVTYSELVQRFGHPMAYDLLLSLEKAAKSMNGTMYISEEDRLRRALTVLHEDRTAAA